MQEAAKSERETRKQVENEGQKEQQKEEREEEELEDADRLKTRTLEEEARED
jgi:hypothetical protein